MAVGLAKIRNGRKFLNGSKSDKGLRESGLGIVGKIPWGIHLCQFYKTENDLLDILAPYFKAGLENNEFCMWVTSEPLSAESVKKEMEKRMPGFRNYLERGQMEIIPYTAWYVKGGGFNEKRVLSGWVDKLNAALEKGYDGLRLTGNTFWLEKENWKAFADYEQAVDKVIGSYKMIAICSYSLDKCAVPEVLDVVSNHEHALIKRGGKWNMVESSRQKETELTSRRNLERYRHYMKVAGGMGWITNAKGEVTEDIPFWRNYTGQSFEEVKGLGWSKALHPDDVKGTVRIWKDAVRKKINYETEYRVRGRDGSYKDFLARGVPVFKNNGNISEWVGTCIDITELKRIGTALGIERDKLRTIIDNIDMGIGITDVDGTTLSLNKEGLRIHGFESEADMFARLKQYTKEFELRYPDGRTMPFKEWPTSRAMRGEYVKNYEVILVRRRNNAESRFISYTVTPVRNEQGRVILHIFNMADFTKYKQAEEALKQRKELLERTQEIAHLGSWELDLINNKLTWSDEVYRIFGLKPQGFGATYEAFIDAVHPDDRKAVNAAYLSSIRNGRDTYEIEHRVVRKSTGEVRFVREGCVHFRNRKGKIIRSVGMVHDITERKQAEMRLQIRHAVSRVLNDAVSQAEALRRILETLGEKIGWDYGDVWLVDRSSNVMRYAAGWNGGGDNAERYGKFMEASRDFQFPLGQGLPGRIWKSRKTEWIANVVKDGNFPRAKIAQMAGLHGAFGFPIIGQQGTLGAVEFLSKKIYRPNDASISFFETIGSQIGQFIERKETEEDMKAQRDILRAVIENSHAQIAYLDKDFNFVLVNSAYESGCGRTAAELIGRNHFDLFPSGENLKIFKKVSATGRPAEFRAKALVFPEQPERGTTYWDWILTPVKNNTKEVTSFVLSLVDVTDKIRKEELQRNFIAILGHELRNPLAPIILSLDLMKSKVIEDPEINETLEIVRHQSSNMIRLVKDLLDVSRIERGKIELQKRAISVRCAIKKAVEAMTPTFEKKNQKLIVSIPQEIIKISADPLRIEQVLVNLLSNASKYSDEGKTVWLRVERKENEVFMAVKDHGIGIAPEALYRIFDLFQRDQTEGRHRGGLGIGLYLSRELARLHGGDVMAHSEGLGKGSEFTVKLPIKIVEKDIEKAVDIRRGRDNIGAVPKGDGKVLVVEDNITLANAMGKIVKTLGREVQVSYNGSDALKTARAFKPDIVLLDLGMPEMDGLEVARRMRKDRSLSNATLVAVTGYGQESDKKEAKRAGFDYYVIKPVGIKELSLVLDGKAPKFKL